MTFETVVLADATLDSALEFVYKHLDREEYPDLIPCVQTIGGRLTDLELFVQKVKSGMGPEGKLEKQMTVGGASSARSLIWMRGYRWRVFIN